MSTHTHGGPPGTRYSMSNSGWMEEANFAEWFRKLFLPAVADMKLTGPVILFVDGHQSHCTLQVVEEARDHGICLYTFPPHTTHLLQPLDVAAYGPLKKVWARQLKEYKLQTMAGKVDKSVFPSILAKMWDQILIPEHLIGGFRGAGIHPLCRDAIPLNKLKTATPFVVGTASPSDVQAAPQGSVLTPATPVTIQIAKHFESLFVKKNEDMGRKKKRTLPKHYGEALTEDEIWERIKEHEEQRKEKAAQKGRKKKVTRSRNGKKNQEKQAGAEDENTCQSCGGKYEDDDDDAKEGWIGCDERGCWRWYHYWCVGKLDVLDPKLHWVCPACIPDD